jgi:hypothetical protein
MINFAVLCRCVQRGGRGWCGSVFACLPITIGVWCFSASAQAAELHCRLERGTTVLHHVQKPVPDPYSVASVPAGPGFQFKSLVFEEQGQVTHVLIHAYYLRNGQPTLLHQANYTRPMVPSAELTGEQVVVEPYMGRELRYHCALLEGMS